MQKENPCDLTFLRYNQAFVGFLKKLWSFDCADFEIKMLIGKILLLLFYIKVFLETFAILYLIFLKGIFTYFLFGFGSLFRTNTSNELARFASSSGF